jgi:hypothetical protein
MLDSTMKKLSQSFPPGYDHSLLGAMLRLWKSVGLRSSNTGTL